MAGAPGREASALVSAARGLGGLAPMAVCVTTVNASESWMRRGRSCASEASCGATLGAGCRLARRLGEKEAVQEEVVPPRSRGARCRGLSKSSAQATPQHSVGGAHVVVEGGDVLKKSASPIMRGHRAHAGTRR